MGFNEKFFRCKECNGNFKEDIKILFGTEQVEICRYCFEEIMRSLRKPKHEYYNSTGQLFCIIQNKGRKKKMSHTTTYKMKVKNVQAFCQIAREHGHMVNEALAGEYFTVKHYGNNVVKNCVAEILLNEWRYPLAISEDGEIMYDHWGSKGGQRSMDYLGECLQEYNLKEIEKASFNCEDIEMFTTKKVANGDIVIEIEY